MKKYIISALFATGTLTMQAQQFDVSADVRIRFENRNGYAALKPDTLKAANFVTQRARLNFDYANKNIKLRLSPQNYRVWGDEATMAKSDLGNSFHEAYGEAIVSKQFSFKVGRQELNYDDARILGNVDWAMQARSHDALLLKFLPDSNNTLHGGFALNANKETNFKENYLVPQYKAIQFLWYHGNFKNMGLSFLLLNNGMTYMNAGKEKIAYSQTIGPRFTYKACKFYADAAAYLQTGKIGLSKVSASYYSAHINYKVSKTFTTGIGFEYLSGKANNDLSTNIKSFNPLYGTNHKFNGFMDYFYVGNHINAVGLTDVYVNLDFEKDKCSVKLTPHYFASAANIYKAGIKQNKYLATEIDLTLGYKLFDNVTLNGGFSKMFATSSMELLKGGTKSNGNNWTYLSIIFNPKLFSYKPDLNKNK